MSGSLPSSQALLVLPRLCVQNANAISSPCTHGFVAMSSLLGLMWALERKLADRWPLGLDSVGVVCHRHEEQTAGERRQRSFCLTRNPIDKDGSTAAIVEEGRIHLEITLVFGVSGGIVDEDETRRQACADEIADVLGAMRLAGGVFLPTVRSWRTRPRLHVLPQQDDAAAQLFTRLRRQWLPGFALVLRDDLLQQRLQTLQQSLAGTTLLDAWLDLSRINWSPGTDADGEWVHDRKEGWIVPIPVGYGALTREPITGVANARDPGTPLQFVESLYGIGQWLSPHRISSVWHLLWYAHTDHALGTYRVHNDYAAALPQN
ncbi:type I-F CRISPR-associated protein Csy2 [Pseudorhodoferax sp.]|uniref:type I-F CRISPR-associated protein Csy2 n=1 Tax=Pseudorhodoferax sp. TaxID=1993553 RepID=UPI002DD661C4|nr:type I-F CRISPR-associated protein Csy2 [Pseudorhodoferax sp.]